MAYDSRRGLMMVFGSGATGSDLWAWDGSTWRLLSVGGENPQFRIEPWGPTCMVYDSARDELVLFGGTTKYKDPGGTATTGTWVRGASGTWTLRIAGSELAGPATGPRGAAFDKRRGRVVVLAGPRPGFSISPTTGTWEWDGQAWSLKNPSTQPPRRFDHAMTYDEFKGRVLMHGGETGQPYTACLGDLWAWDGTDWMRLADGPSVARHALAYGSRLLLFGGLTRLPILGYYPLPSSSTWAWDESTSWVPVQAFPQAPPARWGHGFAFDQNRWVGVAFGGGTSSALFGDTWELQSPVAPTFTSFGAGCRGTWGTPQLAAGPGERPFAGRTMILHLSNLPTAAVAFLLLGVSNTSWGTIQLPFDCGPIGMPGCSILASGDLVLGVPYILGAGRGEVGFRVPWEIGRHIYAQAGALDGPANPLGIVLSNAGEMVIGY